MCYPTNSSKPSGFCFLTAKGDIEGFAVLHQAWGSGKCGKAKHLHPPYDGFPTACKGWSFLSNSAESRLLQYCGPRALKLTMLLAHANYTSNLCNIHCHDMTLLSFGESRDTVKHGAWHLLTLKSCQIFLKATNEIFHLFFLSESSVFEARSQIAPRLHHFSSPRQPKMVLYTLILVWDASGVRKLISLCSFFFRLIRRCNLFSRSHKKCRHKSHN